VAETSAHKRDFNVAQPQWLKLLKLKRELNASARVAETSAQKRELKSSKKERDFNALEHSS
jgi:hypothetical protein